MNSMISSYNFFFSPIYSLGPAWPEDILANADSDDVCDKLIPFVQRRMEIRDRLIQDFVKKRKRNISATSRIFMVIQFQHNNMHCL